MKETDVGRGKSGLRIDVSKGEMGDKVAVFFTEIVVIRMLAAKDCDNIDTASFSRKL